MQLLRSIFERMACPPGLAALWDVDSTAGALAPSWTLK